jgi:hypothetical protein
MLLPGKLKRFTCQKKQTKHINHHSQQQTNHVTQSGKTQAIYQAPKNNPSRKQTVKKYPASSKPIGTQLEKCLCTEQHQNNTSPETTGGKPQ